MTFQRNASTASLAPAPSPSGSTGPLEGGSASGLSRRRFLQVGLAAGGGLVLALRLPFDNAAAQSTDATGFEPNAFIRIGGDGEIVLTMPYVEMGQGTYTAIPMLIAEELEIGLDQVRLEHAPPNAKLYGNPLLGGEQMTGNSNAVRGAWKPLREAGATARMMLIAAAANRWNVDPAPAGRTTARCSTRRPEDGSLMANWPPMRRACPFPTMWSSSGRRTSRS